MPGYRLETANSARAACKSPVCKDEKVKIGKGELRVGTWVEIGGHGSYQWRHWGCTTPKIIENMKNFMEGNFDLLDGFGDLEPEHQEKVKKALEEGHVDDEDWKGDVGCNRPGVTGMTKKTPKKKADASEEDGNESPTEDKKARNDNSGAKKRKAKDEENDDAASEEEKPSALKKRAPGDEKNSANGEETEDDIVSEPEEEETAKAEKDLSNAEEDEAPVAPAKTSRGRGRPRKSPSVPKDASAKPAGKRGRPPKNAAKQAGSDGSGGEETTKTAKPAAKRGRPAKTAKTDAAPAKKAAPRKAAKAKADSRAETEDEQDKEDIAMDDAELAEANQSGDEAEAPKKGRGRPKKVVNYKDDANEDEAEGPKKGGRGRKPKVK